MGLDMELEFDKYCKVGGSPKTVLPSPRHCSRIENRNTKLKPTCRNDLWRPQKDFREISFHRYCSSSRKSIKSRTSGPEGNEVLKRGSVYQSSREVRKTKKVGDVEHRRKIEFSRSSATGLSIGIVDTLCSSDEDSSLVEQKRSSVMSLNSNLNTRSVSKPFIEPYSQEFLDPTSNFGRESIVLSDGFLELSLGLTERQNLSAENVARETIEDPMFRCDTVAGPLNDGDVLHERDTALKFQKSLSAKLALPHTPSRSESDYSRGSSPKVRFSPIRKMFDPFKKPKSQQSPSISVNGPGELGADELATIRGNKILQRSLLRDFSNTSQNPGFGSQVVKKAPCNIVMPCSPAHLRGCLRLENKHGLPFIQFSLNCPEDVFVAKTWKAQNSLSWVYTFHSVQKKRKSNASGWGLKDGNKDCSMVGQMQVSCHLQTKLKDGGAVDNSMVTEFVLYDIAHARQNIAAQENFNYSSNVDKSPNGSNESSVEVICNTDEASDGLKPRHQRKDASNHAYFESSNSRPWVPCDLHPNLEIAAIVIQFPLEKRESLKHMRGDVKNDVPHQNLLDLSVVEPRKKIISDCLSPAKVNVVTPSGSHSLPSTKTGGPSSILDRWRLGGGCDCGGWDMACPLVVFGNSIKKSAENYPLMENRQPMELYAQGPKENTPALSIAVVEEGLYVVDFHAQLSTLQAFSICVAILHGTETSIAVGQEREGEVLRCSSLRVYIEEEVKYLIETVTEEEKRRVGQKMEEALPSFVVNPPFSPIARV